MEKIVIPVCLNMEKRFLPTKPSKSKAKDKKPSKSRANDFAFRLCSTSRDTIKEAREHAQQVGANPDLAEHAAMIRRLGKRVITDIIEIGRRLSKAKPIVGHGNNRRIITDGWEAWLEEEFGWSADTALNFMRVYELSEDYKSRNFRDLMIAPSALYLLANKNTPPAVTEEILERAGAGETITVKAVKEAVKKDDTPTLLEGLRQPTEDATPAEKNNRRFVKKILDITNEFIKAAKFARPGEITDPAQRADLRARFEPLLPRWKLAREKYSWIIDDLCGDKPAPEADGQSEAA